MFLLWLYFKVMIIVDIFVEKPLMWKLKKILPGNKISNYDDVHFSDTWAQPIWSFRFLLRGKN